MYGSVFIFVLFAVLASAMGGPDKEKFMAAHQKCIEESGVDPELVKGPPPKDAPITDKMKCFGACMMKQFGVLKPDGTLDLAKVTSKIPADVPEREKIVAALTTCADKKGANDCETAFEFAKCLHEQKMPHMGHGFPHHHA